MEADGASGRTPPSGGSTPGRPGSGFLVRPIPPEGGGRPAGEAARRAARPGRAGEPRIGRDPARRRPTETLRILGIRGVLLPDAFEGSIDVRFGGLRYYFIHRRNWRVVAVFGAFNDLLSLKEPRRC